MCDGILIVSPLTGACYVITYWLPRVWNNYRSLPKTIRVSSDPWKRAPMSAVAIAVVLRLPTDRPVVWATPCHRAILVDWRKWRCNIALEDVAQPMPLRYDCRSPIVWNQYAPRTMAKNSCWARESIVPPRHAFSVVPLFANTPEECIQKPKKERKTKRS